MMENIVVPHSPQAEEAVVGALIMFPNLIHAITDLLEPSDFYDPVYQQIALSVWKKTKNGDHINIVSVHEDIKGTVKEASTKLTKITNEVILPNEHHVKQWAGIVRENSDRRKLMEMLEKSFKRAAIQQDDVKTILADTQKIDLLHDQDKNDGASIVTELTASQEEFQAKYKSGKKYIGIPSGFEKIDDEIDGLRPGHIWVVGAWTSTGKTQFTLNIVHHLLTTNIPVSIISLEMSRVDTVARIIGIRHNMTAAKVIKGNLNPQEQANVLDGKILLENNTFFVHTNYFDIEKIKMAIRRDVAAHKVQVVLVDYVQNITTDQRMTEYQLVTKVATDLQALARELKISIMLVSQISNESQKGNGAGAGFKGTGALEAVADLAIRLERKKEDELPDEEYVPVTIKIVKNRHGYTGTITNYYMYLKSGKFAPNLFYVSAEARKALSTKKPLVQT